MILESCNAESTTPFASLALSISYQDPRPLLHHAVRPSNLCSADLHSGGSDILQLSAELANAAV